MYKELVNDIKGFERPGHGTLTGWSEQGRLSFSSLEMYLMTQARLFKTLKSLQIIYKTK